MLQQKVAKVRIHCLFHRSFHLGGDKFIFRLGGKFGIRHLHGNDCREPFPRVVTGSVYLGLLRQTFSLDVVIKGARQCRTEARKVRTAVALRNIVGVAENIFLVGVIPLQRHFNTGAIRGIHLEMKRLMNRCFIAVQEIHKRV